MQPVVAVTVGTGCPPSNVALVEDVPQVQVSPLCSVFAPVACDALRPSTVASASARNRTRTNR